MYQVNQTDREKAAAAVAATTADTCTSSFAKVGTGQAPCPTSPTQVTAKGADTASPTLRRYSEYNSISPQSKTLI